MRSNAIFIGKYLFANYYLWRWHILPLSQKECHSSVVLNLTKVYWRRIPELMISNRYTKKDVPSAIGSRTVRGLGEVISGRSFPHTVQCVEATARICDLVVHRRQALPLAPGRPFIK